MSSIDEQKRQLKYEACIRALSVIDAHFSHSLVGDPVKQFVNTEEVRKVHSHLILSCDDIKVVEKFTSIICKRNPIQPTEQLNELRNLIRNELGFGGELPLDKNLTWISKIEADSSPRAN